eukprot:701586-Prymnesium_polylepis.1
MTDRFPQKELEQSCGPESGDWSVMSTQMAGGHKLYAVCHRRGVIGTALHTYLATFGKTRRGKDQAHKEEVDADGHAGPARKCPQILNEWTICQPKIDRSNRFRQFELAIEERFKTQSFPFRLVTTVIVGMSIASAHTMYEHFVCGDMYGTFSEYVEAVAFDGMQNTWDADHSTGGDAAATTRRPPPSANPAAGRAGSPFCGGSTRPPTPAGLFDPI